MLLGAVGDRSVRVFVMDPRPASPSCITSLTQHAHHIFLSLSASVNWLQAGSVRNIKPGYMFVIASVRLSALEVRGQESLLWAWTAREIDVVRRYSDVQVWRMEMKG